MEQMRYEGPEDPNASREEILQARLAAAEKHLADEGRLIPTGVMQEVTSQRQVYLRGTSTAEEEYAVKSQTHLWVVTIAHKATDSILDMRDGLTGDMPILDADTMWMEPAVGCFICEQVYEPRLRRRKCPGEPR